ncbi:hypothetical protein VKT23_018578 [Stygiomarasmius scandens]|uniref:Uncharacterized protein n=1 Tax=Marasmiellus scandens TaxID=2682957 RepID=A0ABR1INZ2_9AGAR
MKTGAFAAAAVLSAVCYHASVTCAQSTHTDTVFTVIPSGASVDSPEDFTEAGLAGPPSFIPIGTASDGSETTYREEVVMTQVFVPSGTDDVATIDSTITLTATQIQSASGLRNTLGPVPSEAGIFAGEMSEERCTFDENGVAECVDVRGGVLAGSTMLETETITGSVAAFTTLTVTTNDGGRSSSAHTWTGIILVGMGCLALLA